MKTTIKMNYQEQKYNTQNPIRLISINILRNANFYSGDSVIKMQIDLQSYNNVFTNQIPNFYEKLTSLIPSLYEHHCSEGRPGGFFIRVQDGTLLGHVIEHVAIELQHLAGMHVGFGKTRQTPREGIYNVVFRFTESEVGILAGISAIHCINNILLNESVSLLSIIEDLINLKNKFMPDQSVDLILNEARKQFIPFFCIENNQLFILGSGKYQKKIYRTLTPNLKAITANISNDRFLSFTLLQNAGLPVPDFKLVNSPNHLYSILKQEQIYYVVIPRYCSQSITALFIANDSTSAEAIDYIFDKSEDFLIYHYSSKDVYHFLVIDSKCVAVVRITFPIIIGDGNRQILELLRQFYDYKLLKSKTYYELNIFSFDQETKNILLAHGINYNSILPKDLILLIKINKITGVVSENFTDIVHQDFKHIAQKAISVLNVDTGVVEIHCSDPSLPIKNSNAYITDIYEIPDLTVFHNPTKGTPINIARNHINYIFKNTAKTHIPLIAVTGSVGKSTFAKIIFRYFTNKNYLVGGLLENRMYIGKNKYEPIEFVNYKTIQNLLLQSEIELAIIEVPVESIIRHGLGYQFADYGIVLNVQNKHIEELELFDSDDLAYAKSVVAEEVNPNGWTILNADDTLVREMNSRIISQAAWFSKKNQKSYSRNYAFGDKKRIEISLHSKSPEIIYIENKKLIDENDNIFDSVIAAVLLLKIMKQNSRDIEIFLDHFEKY